MNQKDLDKKIDSLDKVIKIASKNGLALFLAVIFSMYLIFNNYKLTEKLSKYTEIMWKLSNTLEAVDKRLEIIEEKFEK